MLSARLKHWVVLVVVDQSDEGFAEFLKMDDVLGCLVATQRVTTRVPLRMAYMGMPQTVSLGELDLHSTIQVGVRDIIGRAFFSLKRLQTVLFEMEHES